jgi:hypothetical protein
MTWAKIFFAEVKSGWEIELKLGNYVPDRVDVWFMIMVVSPISAYVVYKPYVGW